MKKLIFFFILFVSSQFFAKNENEALFFALFFAFLFAFVSYQWAIEAKKFLSRPKNFLGFWIMMEKREKSLYQNDLRRILVPFHELFGGYLTRQIGLHIFCTTICITTAEMCLVMAKYSNSRVVKQTSFFTKHSLRKDVEKYLHSSFGLV